MVRFRILQEEEYQQADRCPSYPKISEQRFTWSLKIEGKCASHLGHSELVGTFLMRTETCTESWIQRNTFSMSVTSAQSRPLSVDFRRSLKNLTCVPLFQDPRSTSRA